MASESPKSNGEVVMADQDTGLSVEREKAPLLAMTEEQWQRTTALDLASFRAVLAELDAQRRARAEAEAENARLQQDREALDRIQRENAQIAANWSVRALNAEATVQALQEALKRIMVVIESDEGGHTAIGACLESCRIAREALASSPSQGAGE